MDKDVMLCMNSNLVQRRRKKSLLLPMKMPVYLADINAISTMSSSPSTLVFMETLPSNVLSRNSIRGVSMFMTIFSISGYKFISPTYSTMRSYVSPMFGSRLYKFLVNLDIIWYISEVVEIIFAAS